MRVVLVEDNAMNSELACDLLASEGHEVEVAASGAALRTLLAGGSCPSVILMDISLPDADGVGLLGELREMRWLAAVPVVALTAHALAGDEARLLGAGFLAVITKPIDTRRFVREIERLVGATSP